MKAYKIFSEMGLHFNLSFGDFSLINFKFYFGLIINYFL